MNKKELKVVREKLGVKELQPPAKEKKIPVEFILKVLIFAQMHGFVLDPDGYAYRLRGYLMFNHCPCAPDRKSCPCDQAVDEVTRQGHCKCQLFWRSYGDYLRVHYPPKGENDG